MLRLFDIVLALCMLLVAAVPMLVIALLIKSEDGGPVLFRQMRVGQGGRHFRILKFRSMRQDQTGQGSGEVAGSTLEEKRAARAKFRTTGANDDRITRIGRILRKTHMDELPQVLNVLAGDMSLVGVRPDTPAQEVDYTPAYWIKRHTYRPGITGLAQVHAGNHGTMQDRQRWDSEWIDNRSARLYVIILFKTIGRVLKGSSF